MLIKHSSTEIKLCKVKGKASPMTETGFTEYKNGCTPRYTGGKAYSSDNGSPTETTFKDDLIEVDHIIPKSKDGKDAIENGNYFIDIAMTKT